jgi:adhesin/invasin
MALVLLGCNGGAGDGITVVEPPADDSSGNQSTVRTIHSLNLLVSGAHSIVANGVSTTTLQARALTQNGRAVRNQTVTLVIPNDGGTPTSTQAVTNNQGYATFTLVSSTKAGVYGIRAQSGSIESSPRDVTFVAGPVATINFELLGTETLPADETSQTTFRATARDQFNNPVPNADITLDIPTNGGSSPTSPAITNSNGRATFVLVSSTVPGTYDIRARRGAVNSNPRSVHFIESDNLDSLTLEVTGQDTIVANGTSSTTIDVLALNSAAQPLAGIPVTLNIPGNGGSVGANPITTNGDGIATFTLTSSTTAGTYSFSASSGAVQSNSDDVTFTPGPLASLVLSTTGLSSIMADGSSTTTLEVLAIDGFANPIENVNVSITPPANGGSILPGSADSNASGIATFTLTSSTSAGVYDYQAQA